MLNGIFVFVVLTSVLAAALSGEMQALTDAVIASARNAVDLAIGLVGVMAFFLGLMRVASDAGLMARLARLVSPVMRLLFPALPADSPAISAMLLNISANMLGLANAATPFGIKAIEELDKHNGRRGTATNDMVLFLAINTSGLALIPSGMIAIRASLGSSDAAGIFLTTWFASACATVVGITAAMLLARLPRYRATAPELLAAPAADADAPQDAAQAEMAAERRASPVRRILAALFWVVFLIAAAGAFVDRMTQEPAIDALRGIASFWLLPAVVAFLVLYGWTRQVRVYESLVEGAREGFQVAIRIIPYLVAILVAVGMFRASGSLDLLIGWIAPATAVDRHAGRGPADGDTPAAVGLRRDGHRLGGDDRPRPRLPGRLHGQHVPGQHRDDLLRAGGLLRRRRRQERPPRGAGLPAGGHRRHPGRHLHRQPAVRLATSRASERVST